MGYSNITNPVNYQLASLGQSGLRVITSSFTPVSGEYYRSFEVVGSTAAATATVTATSVNGSNITALELINGTKIQGLFSSLSVSAGTIIAYIA
jgi:hypothetical protein